MEIADHLHGKGPFFVQNLRYPGTATDVTFKIAPGKPPGLDVIQDRLNWIGQWNTEVFFLIGFDKSCQYLQPVSFPCSGCSIKDALDFFKSRIIICLCFYGLDSHGESLRLNCRCIYAFIFPMCTHKTDIHDAVLILYCYDQSIFVSLDIENNSVLRDKTGIAIHFLDIRWG